MAGTPCRESAFPGPLGTERFLGQGRAMHPSLAGPEWGSKIVDDPKEISFLSHSISRKGYRLVIGFCRVSILMKTIYSPSKRTICRRGGRQTVSRHFCSRNAALPVDLPRLVFPFEGDQSRVKIFSVCSLVSVTTLARAWKNDLRRG